MKPHIHTITELAIFTAIAFIFSYIESLFPLPIPFLGIKLGLANLVIVLVLYKNGFYQALTVSIVRGLLNAFTFGSLFGFLYSLAGSVPVSYTHLEYSSFPSHSTTLQLDATLYFRVFALIFLLVSQSNFFFTLLMPPLIINFPPR